MSLGRWWGQGQQSRLYCAIHGLHSKFHNQISFQSSDGQCTAISLLQIQFNRSVGLQNQRIRGILSKEGPIGQKQLGTHFMPSCAICSVLAEKIQLILYLQVETIPKQLNYQLPQLETSQQHKLIGFGADGTLCCEIFDQNSKAWVDATLSLNIFLRSFVEHITKVSDTKPNLRRGLGVITRCLTADNKSSTQQITKQTFQDDENDEGSFADAALMREHVDLITQVVLDKQKGGQIVSDSNSYSKNGRIKARADCLIQAKQGYGIGVRNIRALEMYAKPLIRQLLKQSPEQYPKIIILVNSNKRAEQITNDIQDFLIKEKNQNSHLNAKFQKFLNLKTGKNQQIKWDQEIQANDIMVFLSNKFHSLLVQGYIKISQLDLILLDEAHAFHNDHHYSKIAQQFILYYQQRPVDQPLPFVVAFFSIDYIIGTTNEKRQKATTSLDSLCTLLNIRIALLSQDSLSELSDVYFKSIIGLRYNPLYPFEYEEFVRQAINELQQVSYFLQERKKEKQTIEWIIQSQKIARLRKEFWFQTKEEASQKVIAHCTINESKWIIDGLFKAVSDLIKQSGWKDKNKVFENLNLGQLKPIVKQHVVEKVRYFIVGQEISTYLEPLLPDYGKDCVFFSNTIQKSQQQYSSLQQNSSTFLFKKQLLAEDYLYLEFVKLFYQKGYLDLHLRPYLPKLTKQLSSFFSEKEEYSAFIEEKKQEEQIEVQQINEQQDKPQKQFSEAQLACLRNYQILDNFIDKIIIAHANKIIEDQEQKFDRYPGNEIHTKFPMFDAKNALLTNTDVPIYGEKLKEFLQPKEDRLLMKIVEEDSKEEQEMKESYFDKLVSKLDYFNIIFEKTGLLKTMYEEIQNWKQNFILSLIMAMSGQQLENSQDCRLQDELGRYSFLGDQVLSLNVVMYCFYMYSSSFTEKDLDNHKIHLIKSDHMKNAIQKNFEQLKLVGKENEAVLHEGFMLQIHGKKSQVRQITEAVQSVCGVLAQFINSTISMVFLYKIGVLKFNSDDPLNEFQERRVQLLKNSYFVDDYRGDKYDRNLINEDNYKEEIFNSVNEIMKGSSKQNAFNLTQRVVKCINRRALHSDKNNSKKRKYEFDNDILFDIEQYGQSMIFLESITHKSFSEKIVQKLPPQQFEQQEELYLTLSKSSDNLIHDITEQVKNNRKTESSQFQQVTIEEFSSENKTKKVILSKCIQGKWESRIRTGFHYERLEYLGDVVLNFIIAKIFFRETMLSRQNQQSWKYNYYTPNRQHDLKTWFSSNQWLAFLLVEHFQNYDCTIKLPIPILYDEENQQFQTQIETYQEQAIDAIQKLKKKIKNKTYQNQDGDKEEESKDKIDLSTSSLRNYTVSNLQSMSISDERSARSGLGLNNFNRSNNNDNVFADLQDYQVKAISDIHEAIIGGIQVSSGSMIETEKYVKMLLSSAYVKDFPLKDHERTKCLTIWNSKCYCLNLKITHTIEEKDQTAIYIKGYIQSIECRRIRFQKGKKSKIAKFYAELREYLVNCYITFERTTDQNDSKAYGQLGWLNFQKVHRKIYDSKIHKIKAPAIVDTQIEIISTDESISKQLQGFPLNSLSKLDQIVEAMLKNFDQIQYLSILIYVMKKTMEVLKQELSIEKLDSQIPSQYNRPYLNTDQIFLLYFEHERVVDTDVRNMLSDCNIKSFEITRKEGSFRVPNSIDDELNKLDKYKVLKYFQGLQNIQKAKLLERVKSRSQSKERAPLIGNQQEIIGTMKKQQVIV